MFTISESLKNMMTNQLVENLRILPKEAVSITDDLKISGEEIWNQSPTVRQIFTQTCYSNLACQFANQSNFIQRANQILNIAAGDNEILDSADEVNQFTSVIQNHESADLLSKRLKEIQNEWPVDALSDDQIKILMAQSSTALKRPSDVVVQVAKVKDGAQGGGPSAVRTLAFLPSEQGIFVSRQSAMDFLISHINNFPSVTSLYQKIDVRGNHDASNASGSFQTTNTMVMQNLGVGQATATFDTDISWYQDPEEDGIATVYFSFNSQKPVSGIVSVTAFTGKFIVRPVVDDQGRSGLLFELYVYFDIDVPTLFQSAKNSIVSWLMGDRMKLFCQEIAFNYVSSLGK